MKSIPHLLSVASAATLLAGLAFAADPKPSKAADSGPKTHLLFMGLDLDWQQGRDFHRVEAIRGRTAVVSVGGGEQTVGMGRNNNFKIVNTLKLGKATVRLDQVKLDRFYTPGNDPQKRFREAFALSTAAMDEAMVARQLSMKDQYFPLSLRPHAGMAGYDPDHDAKRIALAETKLVTAMMNIDALSSFTQTRVMPSINPTPPLPLEPKSGSVTFGLPEIKEIDVAVPAKPAGSGASKAPPSAAPAGATQTVPTSAAAAAAAAAAEPLASAASGPTAPEAKAPRVQAAKPAVIADGEGQWFDALDLKFEVSSEKLLAEPYVVIVLSYIDPLKPQEPQQWVHALQLEPVGPTPRLVRLRQGGFPPGFVPKQPSIHVYDRGRELATSAAGGMALTREEAVDYVQLDYLATNKKAKATLAAAPIPASFPEDMAARLQATRFPKDVFVQVNANGMPVEMFADAGRRQRIEDPAVRATVAEVRFCPALEKGKPIEGVARLAFSQPAL